MERKFTLISIFVAGYLFVMVLVALAFRIIDTDQMNKTPSSSITQDMLSPTISPQVTKKLKVHATIPYWEQKKAAEVFKKNVTSFDYLSLFWYRLNANSNIVKYTDAVEDQSIIDFAKKNNVKVLALITNLPEEEGSDWDSDYVRQVIKNQSSRKEHIQEIIQVINSKEFDGVNIDYEELDDDLKDEFSAFISELSKELHLQGKIVSVAIHPKSGEFIPIEDNGSRAQDWQVLAQHADHLYFMTYGEHWNTSGPGPIASIPWDTKIIAYSQRLQLPLEKIYLGIPLYAVRWEKDTKKGEGLSFEDIIELQARFDIKPLWNDQWKSPSLEYIQNGKTYEVWFENAASVEEKIKLAERSGIGGITFWHIGGEDPNIWNVVK